MTFNGNTIDGILFIGCEKEGEKTNPEKISEWFNEDFMKLHKVYAIKEEEAFLLKIYTREREIANKVIRRKGGRKPMLMGQEVHGEIIVACGKCGYRSSEGSNVRRHLKKSVCSRERGYSKKELDGLNRIERQKLIRRVATAKFRAKKKLEAITMTSSNVESNENTPQADAALEVSACHLKVRKKVQTHKALTLGPLVENEAVRRVSYDVFTVSENNVRVAWKPPACHKASGDTCQIVFKGARMKRRCLDLPLPIILTYRKLDCKVHHCNFTLFHPHARKAFKEDSKAKATVNVRTYGDTVMTLDFYHHFVSLLSVMRMKSSQCARHLTSVWETILIDRLQTSEMPEEHRKIITFSKQTVKSIWASIEEESGKKNPAVLSRPKKKKRVQSMPSPKPANHSVTHQDSDVSFSSSSLPVQPSLNDIQMQQQTQNLHHHHHHHPHSHFVHNQISQQPHHQHQQQHLQPQQQINQDFQQQTSIKRFSHPLPKHSSSSHSIALPHSHTMLQAPPHPHWVSHIGQTHTSQYPPSMPYSVSPHHEEYYSVQGSFVTQYTPVTVGSSP